MATEFVTLSDVVAAPNAAGTALLFGLNTDRSVQLRIRVWRDTNPATVITGTEAGAGVGPRALSVNITSLAAQGGNLIYEITSVTAPPPTLRPFSGSVRIGAARTVANGRAVNVRWNQFAWNRYTWAQYNPTNQAALVTP